MNDRKSAYAIKMQSRLNQMSAEIEKMKTLAGDVSTETRIEYRKHIRNMLERKKVVGERLTELKNAPDNSWERQKRITEHAWRELSYAVKSASIRFK